jgi:hypothetical protein
LRGGERELFRQRPKVMVDESGDIAPGGLFNGAMPLVF